MDHMHAGHGGMGINNDHCSMHMLFNWSTENLCIVFPWWHIRSNMSLLVSLLAIVALGAGYEALRSISRRYETRVAKRSIELPRNHQVGESKQAHIVKAALYALQTFYAFMLMLVFMTYNGWVMIAVTAGAFIGYVVFGVETSATKDSACH